MITIINRVLFSRCAKYTSVPTGCTLIPDPKDPTCCKIASCPLPPTMQPNPTPGFVNPNPNTPAPPQVTGVAPVPTPVYIQPTPAPGQTLAPNPNPTMAPTPKTGRFMLVFENIINLYLYYISKSWLVYTVILER